MNGGGSSLSPEGFSEAVWGDLALVYNQKLTQSIDLDAVYGGYLSAPERLMVGA
jgi:hypothetical protein